MGKTFVAAEQFAAINTELGLPTTDMAGFVKVQGPTGYRLYIGRTKKVARVDLSGFTVPNTLGVTDLGEKSFGNVKQQLDFTQPESVILDTYRLVATTMKGLAPVEKAAPAKKERKARAPKGEKPEAGKVEAEKVSPTEQRIRHLQGIVALAESRNVKVSKKVTDELDALLAEEDGASSPASSN